MALLHRRYGKASAFPKAEEKPISDIRKSPLLSVPENTLFFFVSPSVINYAWCEEESTALPRIYVDLILPKCPRSQNTRYVINVRGEI